MKPNKINNIDELRLEISRLKQQAREQEIYLGEQYGLLKKSVEGPVQFFNDAVSFIPGAGFLRSMFSSSGGAGNKKDWVSRIFSAGLATVVNRLFLRRAGVLKRILLTALTQQAAGQVNKDRAVSIISWLADSIRPKKSGKDSGRSKKRGEEPLLAAPDFGIPPDSETS